MNRRIYENPPIEEAVCELVFEAGEADITLPARFMLEIEDDYDGKPQEIPGVQAQLRAGPEGESAFSLAATGSRIQFPSSDGRRALALGTNVLAVHAFRPYEGWETFERRIGKGIEVTEKLGAWRPIVRIGIRYINKIHIPEPEIDLDDYFVGAPSPPRGLGLATEGFLYRNESRFQDDQTRLVLTFASADAPPQMLGLLLDIDVITELGGQELSTAEAMERIAHLRNRERAVFETLITDRTRGLFGND